MVETGLISVIVPVYNMEKYVARCIESILAQTYLNWELFLVDDGSIDKSRKICEEYAEKDSRINVLSQNNAGIGPARNNGLNKCRGEYITFVDADDFIHPEYMMRMLDGFQTEDVDIVVCQCRSGCENSFTKPLNYEKKQSYRNNEKYYNLFNENKETMVINCAKVYKRTVWENLRYIAGIRREDEYMILTLLKRCRTVIYLSNALYYHYYRADSVANERFQLSHLCILDILNDRIRYFDEQNLRKLAILARIDYMRRVQFHYYSLKKYFPEEKESISRIWREYKECFENVKGQIPITKRLRYGLFLTMPHINKFIKQICGARKI